MMSETMVMVAQRRLAAATDALSRLSGAQRVALSNGDAAWVREVREALPAALAEQRAASDALRASVGHGSHD